MTVRITVELNERSLEALTCPKDRFCSQTERSSVYRANLRVGQLFRMDPEDVICLVPQDDGSYMLGGSVVADYVERNGGESGRTQAWDNENSLN